MDRYKKNNKNEHQQISRRNFCKTSALFSLAAFSSPHAVYAAGSDKMRVGLIGCGNRGRGSAMECAQSSDGVEIVAMADLFPDKIQESLNFLKENTPANLKVTPETTFLGFDAYKKVIDCDIDMVILATQPHFRPMHLKAAIEAGKNVFMEKPVAVDPVGVRSIIESSKLAQEKKLAIVAGTQRRHQNHYIEIIKRIRDGDIGRIVAAQCYWVDSDVATWGFLHKRQPGWSDMEWQCRNWYYFTWASGDHYVEQHVHNLDVVNWALNAHPIQRLGLGGRQARTGPEYGNIFDHFAVDYEYPDNIHVLSMARQIDDCSSRVSERIVGTNGEALLDQSTGVIEGANPYKYDGPNPNPYVTEHADLIASIREGKPLNEGQHIAESTLTAIMGRMSTYTGRALKWNWVMNESKLDLSPPRYEFGDLPIEPVAIPGQTKLV